MSTPGYSGKSLVEKLGYLPGDRVFCINAPGWFTKELETNGIEPVAQLPATWSHVFLSYKRDLEAFIDAARLEDIEKGLWLSWPKKSAKTDTDITEQTLRDFVLPLGWVDTKVASVDETWSGLKFLKRKN